MCFVFDTPHGMFSAKCALHLVRLTECSLLNVFCVWYALRCVYYNIYPRAYRCVYLLCVICIHVPTVVCIYCVQYMSTCAPLCVFIVCNICPRTHRCVYLLCAIYVHVRTVRRRGRFIVPVFSPQLCGVGVKNKQEWGLFCIRKVFIL